MSRTSDSAIPGAPSFTRWVGAVGGCLGVLLLGMTQGCAGGSTPPAAELTGDAVRIEEARAVQVPGGGTGAVYLDIVNPTSEDDVLEAVATPAAKVAEVHETVEEDGLMKMEAFPEGLPVPAESLVALEPGGKHVMLMALEERLEPGSEIELELRFRRAGTLRITVPVVEIGSG